MAGCATHGVESIPSPIRRGIARGGLRRSQEAHEVGKELGIGEFTGVRVALIFGSGCEGASPVLFPLLGKQFVGHADFDIIRLPGEDQQRLVLCLPAEAGNSSVVPIGIESTADP